MTISSRRRSEMPKYIQLLYLGHVKMQLVDEEFQYASVDITNGLNTNAILRLFSTVVHAISLK